MSDRHDERARVWLDSVAPAVQPRIRAQFIGLSVASLAEQFREVEREIRRDEAEQWRKSLRVLVAAGDALRESVRISYQSISLRGGEPPVVVAWDAATKDCRGER